MVVDVISPCCATRFWGRLVKILRNETAMNKSKIISTEAAAICATCILSLGVYAETSPSRYHVIAFYTGKDETAHISFVEEAQRWFARMAVEHGFSFESTTNWDRLKLEFLSRY